MKEKMKEIYDLEREYNERRNGMEMAIRRYLSVDPAALERVKMANKQTETNLRPRAPQSRMKLSWEPSLLLHSPNHADGKTLLIQAIAQKIGCTKIHLIRPGQLMAKYGIHADSALECLLHGFLVSAATQDQRICIILDDLDGMMPPRMCGKSGAGDAAVPVFNAVGKLWHTSKNRPLLAFMYISHGTFPYTKPHI